jgi:hypothetical protein
MICRKRVTKLKKRFLIVMDQSRINDEEEIKKKRGKKREKPDEVNPVWPSGLRLRRIAPVTSFYHT